MARNILIGGQSLSRCLGYCLELRCRPNNHLLPNKLGKSRQFTCSSIILHSDKHEKPATALDGIKQKHVSDQELNNAPQSSDDSGSACRMIEFRHYPSDYDKKRLVLARMYKKEDIPEWVTHSEMAKAGDLYRIRFNLKAIIFVQLVIILLIVYHKGERSKGNTINTLDKRYITKMRAIGLREEAEAAEKKRLEALKKLGV